MSIMEIPSPCPPDIRALLKPNQPILLTGKIYSARDVAHQRLFDAIKANKPYDIPLENHYIYYVGPTPTRTDGLVGSAGPTTSGRMDPYTALIIEHYKIAGTIGKGVRSKEVWDAIKTFNAPYLLATGGAGALLAKTIKSIKPVLFPELGPEAIFEMTVEKMPLIVGCENAKV
jgi:fumarate hydratase subunit beta